MMTQEAQVWAENRGITEQTLGKMRVEGGAARFGDTSEQSIVFNYFEGDKLVNRKVRSLEGKKWKQQQGGKQVAYNWDRVKAGPKDVCYIVEGEMDALSLIEAGIDAVISCPSGAPAEASDDPAQGRKYVWAIDAMNEGLKDFKRYIIAVDNDGPGRALRSDLVAILGPAKTFFIDWPEGIKDANELLVAEGRSEILREFLTKNAKPWPVKGIWTMSQIPEPAPLELWELGFSEFESKIRLAPTTLSVVTGYPGHGKSHMFQQVWFNIARQYGIRVAIFSAETRIKPFLRRNFRQFYWRQLEYTMSPQQLREADEWLEHHLVLMDVGDEVPNMKWLVDSIEIATQRHGCRAALIDPWNKIEEDFDPRQTTETRWIGQMLDLLIQMSRGLSIHTQIIAHPAKPDAAFKKYAPDLYSISGSAHWSNRVDQGFTVFREKILDGAERQTGAELKCLKSRFADLGHPCSFNMDYDLQQGIFRCTEYETKLQTGLRAVD
jgi:twinkle protein